MAIGAMVKTGLQTVTKGANLGDAMNIIGGIADYKDARNQGDSRAVSLAKSVGSFAFYEMLGPAAIGVVGIQVAGTLLPAVGEHTAKTMAKGYGQRGKLGSGYFDMTQSGYTMRQRSLNAIRSNGLNTQNALGNEARTFYRG